MHSKEQLWKMPMAELEKIAASGHPQSATWAESWPVYEIRRRRLDARRTWVCFSISTLIGLVALIRTFIV